MALNIEISGEYRLTSDNYQIVVQRLHFVDPTKSPAFKSGMDATVRQEWRDWKYCGKLEHALELIIRQRLLESDATTLAQLLNEMSAIKREISRYSA